MNWTRPHTRVDHLEVNELPDGYVVYQQDVDRVHYLNRTAVLVFELCDGKTPARDIPALVRTLYGLEAVPQAEVEACLERFLTEGLILPA